MYSCLSPFQLAQDFYQVNSQNMHSVVALWLMELLELQ